MSSSRCLRSSSTLKMSSDSSETDYFVFDEKTPGKITTKLLGYYRKENNPPVEEDDEEENVEASEEDHFKTEENCITTKSFYGKKNPRPKLRKIEEIRVNRTKPNLKRNTRKFVTKTKGKRVSKMRKTEREILVVTTTEGITPTTDTRKRKFFSKRSPSKKPKSVLMVGNNKVIFKSSIQAPKSEPNPAIIEESDEMETLSNELLQPPVETESTVEVFNLPQVQNEIEIASEIETTQTTEIQPKEIVAFYPLFTKNKTKSNKSPLTPTTSNLSVKKTRSSRRLMSINNKKDKMEQLVIDVGQKEVAPVECETCGMIYTPCDAEDTKMHNRHHNARINALNFAGWKNEKVVGKFDDGRVILVDPRDPRYAQIKMTQVWNVLDLELGEMVIEKIKETKFLFFVSKDEKKIVGFLSAEPVTKAYPAVTTDGVVSYHEDAPVPILCGISRIWTLATHRKKSIATRLVDCLRSNFVFGYVMSPNDIAFSGPTADGAIFAAKYTKPDSFLVYK